MAGQCDISEGYASRIVSNQAGGEPFYLSDGSTVRDYYVKGEGYAAAKLDLKNGESMVFFLPDQGTSPYDLLKNPTRLFGECARLGAKASMGNVFKVPKFKFSSKMKDLQEVLMGMGILTVFQPEGADFGNR